ncbi:MAG: outer membrane beta-barrel protein [Woeseiaceae bacterium]|nr:outer membrane beta-barrel protein [Woeseiaceae bacterium]MDX2606865.1 outer membrane beta-barrel protein [Woeseiaceae bacterium]
MKKLLFLIAALSIQATAAAQSSQQPETSSLSYSYAELRYVDVDTGGGDGFSFGGSYELDGPWILVGALNSLEFNNNVDFTLVEFGGGYVWTYANDFDLVSTLRFVRAEVDTPGGDSAESGFALSSGVRVLVTPEFEVRGSVNHLNLDNNDTYLQLAGDYFFTDKASVGVSLDFGGDMDNFTLGFRWFFR